MSDSDAQIRAFFRQQSQEADSEALRRLYGFLGLEPLVFPAVPTGPHAPQWCSLEDLWLSLSQAALAQPREGLAATLPEPPEPFLLGRYVEMLARWLCEELLDAELIAHNFAIRDPQAPEPRRTIGELDLVYRVGEQKLIRHRELAAKWYLYDPFNAPESKLPWACDWWGPQRRDRLDLKLERMLNHQLALGQHPATKALLGDQSPQSSELWMNGQLFWPLELALPKTQDHARPQVNPAAIVGRWARYSQWRDYAAQKRDSGKWFRLAKSQWLSPRHPSLPQEALSSHSATLGSHPQLLALRPGGPGELGLDWVEVERFFVVPDDWGQAGRGA